MTANAFDNAVVRNPLPVLVDFYAPWCGPCQMLAPVLRQLATVYEGRVSIAKVNIDEAPELARRYNIRGVPTLMLFHHGSPIETLVGLPSVQGLRSVLDAAAEGQERVLTGDRA